MTCSNQSCASCGDRLVHQTSKSAHESSSALGQYVHDNYAKDFYYADIDAAVYKRATGVLRIIEHKHTGQSIRPSQKSILPLLSIAVQGLVQAGLVHPESGVFTMYASDPFDIAAVKRVSSGAKSADWASTDGAALLTGSLLTAFLTGQVIADEVTKMRDGRETG